jgi:hypothetical protein
MNEDMIALLLSVALAAIAAHVVFAGILRPRVEASLQAELFAWGHVRGGKVQSLKFRYLLPWVPVPPLPSSARWLFILSRATAGIAVIAAIILVALGYVFAVA